MTDSSLISSLSRYSRILKALRLQMFYSTLIVATINNVENFLVSLKSFTQAAVIIKLDRKIKVSIYLLLRIDTCYDF